MLDSTERATILALDTAEQRRYIVPFCLHHSSNTQLDIQQYDTSSYSTSFILTIRASDTRLAIGSTCVSPIACYSMGPAMCS